jgi:hypothetical protein
MLPSIGGMHVKNDKQFRDLLKLWNSKLKQSGFKDIESWSTSGRQHTQGFLNDINRNKNRDVIRGKEEKYRMISLYANHYPNLSADLREVLILYANECLLSEAIVRAGNKISYTSVKQHLSVKKKLMIDFVRQLDEEANND